MRLQQYLQKADSKSPTKQIKGTTGRLERLVQRIEAATKIVVEFRIKQAQKSSEVLSQRARSTSSTNRDRWPRKLSKELIKGQEQTFRQSHGFEPLSNSSAEGSHLSLETSSHKKIPRFEDSPRKLQEKSHKILTMEQTLNRLEQRLGAARNTLSNRLKSRISLSQQRQITADKQLQETTRTVAKNSRLQLVNADRTNQINNNIPEYYTTELVRSVNEKYSIALEHVRESIVSLSYFRTYPIPHPPKALNLKKRNTTSKTIVFDLDDTLVHYSESGQSHYDVKLSMIIQTGDKIKAYINIRPYALCLLKKMRNLFEIIVMSAADQNYVKEVVSFLDPQGNIIDHVLYGDSCFSHPNGIIKDLRVLGRDLSQVVIVDNTPFCYGLQPLNAIPILPYYGDNSDNSLRKLEDYLLKILDAQDVRHMNRETFHLDMYHEFTQPHQLISSLFM